MSVGDIHSKERGSGARFNDGKPPISLFPLETIHGACHVLDYGRRKYAEWNWAKGAKHSVPFDSLIRHLSAWQSGEDTDEESGLNHLDLAMCNMMFLIYYSKHYPELDDRFKVADLPNAIVDSNMYQALDLDAQRSQ